jgi:hypothetical protein
VHAVVLFDDVRGLSGTNERNAVLPPTDPSVTEPREPTPARTVLGELADHPVVLAVRALSRSEVIGVERNNPPDSNVRELWPVDAQPLVDLLSMIVGARFGPHVSGMPLTFEYLDDARERLWRQTTTFAERLLEDLARPADDVDERDEI